MVLVYAIISTFVMSFNSFFHWKPSMGLLSRRNGYWIVMSRNGGSLPESELCAFCAFWKELNAM